MVNDKILLALEKQRNDHYNYLSSITISGLFKEELKDLKSGKIGGDIDPDYENELKEYSKNTSFDKPFRDKVEMLKQMNDDVIIDNFQIQLSKLIEFLAGNNFHTKVQCLFLSYDYYYHFKGIFQGLGKQDYPIIEVPRYASSEYDYTNVIFSYFEGINFEQAWVNCEEFDWLSDYFDVNYEIEELFRLHSRVLLHKALRKMEDSAKLQLLLIRPFSFYISQHDSEAMSLYWLD